MEPGSPRVYPGGFLDVNRSRPASYGGLGLVGRIMIPRYVGRRMVGTWLLIGIVLTVFFLGWAMGYGYGKQEAKVEVYEEELNIDADNADR